MRVSESEALKLAMRMAESEVTLPSRHPGVVLLKPEPVRRVGWRVRYKDPNSGKIVKVTVPNEHSSSHEAREAFAIAMHRDLAYVRGEHSAKSSTAKQNVVFVELPRDVDGEALFFYVIEIRGVGCKVGITKSPRKRAQQHVDAANKHGRIVGRVWFSARCATAEAIERKMRGDSRDEYLSASFGVLVQRAKMLGAADERSENGRS